MITKESVWFENVQTSTQRESSTTAFVCPAAPLMIVHKRANGGAHTSIGVSVVLVNQFLHRYKKAAGGQDNPSNSDC